MKGHRFLWASGLCLLLLTVLLLVGPATASAEVSGACGTVTWTISDDGKMVFSPTSGSEGTLATFAEMNAPWQEYADQIKSISFTGTVHAAVNSSYLFAYLSALESIDFTNFDTASTTNLEGFLGMCPSLKSADMSGLSVDKVTNISYLFYNAQSLENVNLSTWNTSAVKTLIGMFYACKSLKTLDLSNFNTANVTTMHNMFNSCETLESVNLSSFNTSNVSGTGMAYLFKNCFALKSADLSSFSFAKLTGIYNLFSYCTSLESVTWPETVDIRNVTNMSYMFSYCTSLKSMDMSGFLTSTKLARAETVFGECKSMETLDISGLNLTNAGFGTTGFDVHCFLCYDNNGIRATLEKEQKV